MNFDKRDKAIMKASALVGFCESVDSNALASEPVRSAWIKRLHEYAANTGLAIGAAFSEVITVPGDDITK